MRKMLIILSLIVMLTLIACPKSQQETKSESTPTESNRYEFRHDGSLEVFKGSASIATFDIEIVEEHADRARGLMFRERMEDHQGMLFIFDEIDYHSFWMQNTYLPLDMIFIDSRFRIVHIEENTIPFSEEIITPETPALYVLETKAGIARKLNLSLGDTVKWNRISD